MTNLIAKPILSNKFWIVTDGTKKIGNIEANGDGFGLRMNGTTTQFSSAEDLMANTKITFASIDNSASRSTPYPEYPCPNMVYNSIADIQRGLHLFTKTATSKCLHAAGYFILEQTAEKEVVFCPKYIFLQRYQYQGPFKTKAEAKSKLNIT